MNCRYGVYASVVEVTKPTDGGKIAMIHAGSDCFLRACYAPNMRAPHPVTVFDKGGAIKEGDTVLTDIAGPLCFAGDIVCSGTKVRVAALSCTIPIRFAYPTPYSAHRSFPTLASGTLSCWGRREETRTA